MKTTHTLATHTKDPHRRKFSATRLHLSHQDHKGNGVFYDVETGDKTICPITPFFVLPYADRSVIKDNFSSGADHG